MLTKKHFGTVKQGKFIADDPCAFKLSFCILEDKPVTVTVAKTSKKRSSNQNRYYWGVVAKLVAEATGYTTDEAHDALRWQFLKKVADGMPDTVKSTKELTTAEFEDYMTEIRQWASVALSCYIPEPNEVEY